MAERLQKVLARQGLGSRRALEAVIAAGRVTVNGQVAALGTCVTHPARITIDGELVLDTACVQAPPCRVLMYYKPVGEVTTWHDPQGRPTVIDRIPSPPQGRWIYVGRLDLNSAGLLLLTTDGELANALMHPRQGVLRTYAVRVFGELDAARRAALLQGVELSDGRARAERVVLKGGEGANRWYEVSLREGRNRELRRMFEALQLTVSRLIRIRYASVSLDRQLSAGEYRELRPAELNALRRCAGLPALPQPPAALPSPAAVPRKLRSVSGQRRARAAACRGSSCRSATARR